MFAYDSMQLWAKLQYTCVLITRFYGLKKIHILIMIFIYICEYCFETKTQKIPCNLHPSGRICGSTHSTYFYIYLYIMDIWSLQHNNRSYMKTLINKEKQFLSSCITICTFKHLYLQHPDREFWRNNSKSVLNVLSFSSILDSPDFYIL